MLKKGFYENLGGLAIMALTLVVFAVIACVGDPAYAWRLRRYCPSPVSPRRRVS